MKLSTKSRYGVRMMLELARHYDDGPLQLRKIADRQKISVKYLEQIIIPLKKAKFVSSIRGPKGGHMLAKSPGELTIGQIVEVLEGSMCFSACALDDKVCQRSSECSIRSLWVEATKLVYEKLNSVSLLELVGSGKSRLC